MSSSPVIQWILNGAESAYLTNIPRFQTIIDQNIIRDQPHWLNNPQLDCDFLCVKPTRAFNDTLSRSLIIHFPEDVVNSYEFTFEVFLFENDLALYLTMNTTGKDFEADLRINSVYFLTCIYPNNLNGLGYALNEAAYQVKKYIDTQSKV